MPKERGEAQVVSDAAKRYRASNPGGEETREPMKGVIKQSPKAARSRKPRKSENVARRQCQLEKYLYQAKAGFEPIFIEHIGITAA